MGTITLTYQEILGETMELTFDSDVKEIGLSLKLISIIDLSPLSSCTSLQELNLSWNQLQEVDLTPLASCTTLQGLYLDDNELQEVDLSPLASCTNLQRLNLQCNQLQEVDFTPLTSCTSLQELYLVYNHNQLQEVKLCGCTSLQKLFLWGNQLQELDLTPLASCSSLQELLLGHADSVTLLSRETMNTRGLRRKPNRYDFPVHILSLRHLRVLLHLLRKHEPDVDWKETHLTQGLVTALDLDELPLLDITHEKRDAILDEDESESMRQKVIEALCRQIDDNGTTIGMDVERAVAAHGELANRMEWILELRQQELEDITLGINPYGETVNLKALWLTAYGHQVLSSMGLGLSCSKDQFRQVRESLARLGVEVETTESDEPVYPPTKISDALKEYIWRLAEHHAS
ncbi:MAG: leucine-rich repeat protein [Candidatus Lokiarchaeota archaeon]|nr:leucine-rich repeat protein [Candidatus Lokiarchaeota archaeon]